MQEFHETDPPHPHHSEAYHIASILDPQFEEDGVTSVLCEVQEDSGQWSYSIYVPENEANRWDKVIHDRLGQDCFGLDVVHEPVADIDWVSKTLRELSPVDAGRFFVHGSHEREAARHRRIPIEIDAGQAFDKGHHGTTAGCLEMLESCLRESSGQLGLPRRALDVGTGSGVLT